MLTLNNLEKVGLLKIQGQRSYPTIRKSLRLLMEEVNEQVRGYDVINSVCNDVTT